MDLFITQRDKEKDLYTSLQKETLESIQDLSGKIWTDYNAHDPGITILDVLNYSLTELAYKLSFPLEDYLTGEKETFRPEEYGLFLPDKIFPVAPVTIQDYRKLFLMNIPELENVWIDVDRPTGKYFIHLETYSFLSGILPDEIIKRVRELYHANRNLCESVEVIDFVKLEEVRLQAEIRIKPGVDATALLVRVFHETYAYLAEYVHYEMPEERIIKGITPDEWLDGPNDTGTRISSVSEKRLRTQNELYRQLCRIEGIEFVHSCYIRDKEGRVINHFEKPYSLLIPQSLPELNRYLQVKIDEVPVVIRFDNFLSEFNTVNFSSGNYMKINAGEKFSVSVPAGEYRPVYIHDTVCGDFPDCYGINEKGLSAYVADERKAQARQLKAYLSLFDFTFSRGLEELAGLRKLMKLEYDNQIGELSKKKEQLLDILDALYGEDSNPAWLNEYNYYDDTPETRLQQRIHFLQRVPEWGKNRFKACDINGQQGLANIPGIKAYVSTLLNWQSDESRAVGNIFPSYNLNLISDEEYDNTLNRMSKSDLIHEKMLHPGNIEPIRELFEEYAEKDYEEMRFSLPFFYNNLIYEALFQGGINLENYKIVHAGDTDFLLAFRNQKKNVWMSLGRSVKKEHLNRMANILRHFLIKLNRESETMYVVEHIFFKEREPFVLTVIMPAWSARMVAPRFRDICRKFILSRLPAHIKVHFKWFNIDELQLFEVNWRKWRIATIRGNREMAADAMENIEIQCRNL